MGTADKAKAIQRRVAHLKSHLAVWAMHMAARYNAPVYLLGSVMTKPEPRDIDIRIPIQDREFAARYGATLKHIELEETHHYRKRTGRTACDAVAFSEDGPTQRWVDDVAKFNAHLSLTLHENFDVQTVPDTWWRADVYPAAILLAAPSPHWFIYSSVVPDPSRKLRKRPA